MVFETILQFFPVTVRISGFELTFEKRFVKKRLPQAFKHAVGVPNYAGGLREPYNQSRVRFECRASERSPQKTCHF